MDDSTSVRSTDTLRCLPAVHEVLKHPSVNASTALLGQDSLANLARSAIDAARATILKGETAAQLPTTRAEWMDYCVRQIAQRLASNDSLALQPVFNGTGVLLHTNLGRAPLAPSAKEAIDQAAGYVNVELDVQSGRRARRGIHTLNLLAELTGAESALVVNNCAAATVLALAATSSNRETVISRSQLVEIGGGFRLPEVFQSAGALLREVGTTNRTYLRDFENALTDETAAIMRVHRSNFEINGFCTEPALGELAELAASRRLTMIDDVGSGCLYDFQDLPDRVGKSVTEPNVRASVRAGADLVLFSGDKLFGGPQAGIIVGKAAAVASLASHPLMRALRPDKLTLAGLAATTQLHLSGEFRDAIPLYRQLYRNKSDVETACGRIVSSLEGNRKIRASVVSTSASVGGGTLPGFVLPSFAVRLTSERISEAALAERLRRSRPAILSRVESEAVLIDMRCIDESDEDNLVHAIRNAADSTGGAPA